MDHGKINGVDDSEIKSLTKDWIRNGEFGLRKPDWLFKAADQLGYDGIIADVSLKSPARNSVLSQQMFLRLLERRRIV